MYKSQCLFAVLVQFLALVHSWDLAITTGDQIELYTNGTRESSVDGGFRELTALAYDAVHNMLLFVDKQSDNTSIFSYNLDTKKYQHLVRKRPYENIQGIAFDPVKSILFWTDFNERSIYWISLKPGFKNDKYGNLLIKLEDELPRAIAVDSCRGYVYWTNTNITRATIERARFDGSEREVVVETDVYMPVSLAIDQSSQRLYWADDSEGIHYAIESSDLDGKNRKTLIKETQHQPNSLTVSNDSVYWVDWGFKYVWKLPKTGEAERPLQMIPFVNSNKVAFGIVANYKIEDQTKGVPECKALMKLTQNKPAINDTFDVPKFSDGFCLNNGLRVDGGATCDCTAGFSGERCELSLCHNFCLNGECNIVDGLPSCRCKEGFEGTRCETPLCDGFCLNNGMCSVDNGKPSCRCGGHFEGQRCQTEKVEPKKTLTNVPPVPSGCNCTSDSALLGESCTQGWDVVRDPILMALGLLCGGLCVVCAALVIKILQLKKRPRIKKRIIVNKNVTPLTARPDQCEITIENCCNMNICETPCFEPRSTIRPTLKDAKPGKEEKRNLIANIEYPEDY